MNEHADAPAVERAEGAAARRVCVVGLGYIGLPTAAVLASRGFEVHGTDVSRHAVDTINAGRAHIVEPDLDMLVQAGVATGRLRAHTEAAPADVFVLCVPTPLDAERRPDLSYVDAAAELIAPHLAPGNLVVLESTSPPGTTERLAGTLRRRSGLDAAALHVVHAPERVLPGRILREVVENDRIVGGVDEPSTAHGAAFYGGFVAGRVLETGARTAECAKLVENAYRDVNIAFANELSMVAETLGIDVRELIALANHHPRVNILSPGPGVGGHCIAVDPYFLIDAAPGETPLIAAARAVNSAKPDWVVERVARLAARFRSPVIACLGLAYKPDIDDLRESPALAIVRALGARLEDASLRVVEPNIGAHPEFELADAADAVREADIVVVLVGHREFRRLSAGQLAEKVVLDTCGALARDTGP